MKYAESKQGYINLFAKMKILPEKKMIADSIAQRLGRSKERYENAVKGTIVPWWWVAIVHSLEGSSDFDTYLGNGQSLRQVTTIVPIGRGPFASFEVGVKDALGIKNLDEIKSWEVSRCLFEWERWNGWGYVGKINSPYLWSFSNLEETGKYIRDHVWDPTFKSEQCGAAVILRAMIDLKIVEEIKDPMTELKDFLKQFARIAPTLVTVIAGPVPGLAIKALAEALTNETGVDTGDGLLPPKPEIVLDKLETSPLTMVVNVIQAAEAIIELVADKTPTKPVEVPVVVAAPPVAPVIVTVPAVPTEVTTTVETKPEPPAGVDVLDQMFPGLAGWKTYIAIAIYVVGNIAAVMVPTVVTPDILSMITWLAAGIGGAGLISKADRYLAIFKPSLKTTTVLTK